MSLGGGDGAARVTRAAGVGAAAAEAGGWAAGGSRPSDAAAMDVLGAGPVIYMPQVLPGGGTQHKQHRHHRTGGGGDTPTGGVTALPQRPVDPAVLEPHHEVRAKVSGWFKAAAGSKQADSGDGAAENTVRTRAVRHKEKGVLHQAAPAGGGGDAVVVKHKHLTERPPVLPFQLRELRLGPPHHQFRIMIVVTFCHTLLHHGDQRQLS